MANIIKETISAIDKQMREQTPEQWHRFYKETYPDITIQEAGKLSSLWLMITDTARAKEQRDTLLWEYKQLLAPIKKRNPPQREQELFTWKT